MSTRNHPTEKVAEIAEKMLKAHVESQPTYVRDTTDFLKKLKEAETSLRSVKDKNGLKHLFCMDVRKLYPSVPKAEGLEACKKALEDLEAPSIPTEEAMEMIQMVLENNTFSLDQRNHYIQKDGTAIGSRLGKSYACTYMGRWETELLSRAKIKPLIFYRFVDDIFGIFGGTVEQLNEFHQMANSIHPNIEVDLRHSTREIDFLDVRVGLIDGSFTTDLYTKPNDKKTYLHYRSDHPQSVKDAIPLGLFARAKRICSTEDKFVKQSQIIKDRLTQRGYPEKVIHKQYEKIKRSDRSSLLERKKQRSNKHRVPLAVTFSKHLPDIRKILKKHKHILHRSENMKKIFPDNPILAFKRGANIRDSLVHAKTRRAMTGERKEEKACRCKICSIMMTEVETEGKMVGRGTIGCKTGNVVYGVFCVRCKRVVYVGETGTSLYSRIQNHLSSIRCNRLELPVARHFSDQGHDVNDMRIVGLERVWRSDVFYRRQREMRWIHLLGTDGEHGGCNKRKEGVAV